MAKQVFNPKADTLARIKRTDAYAEKVRLLFAQTVNAILALNKTMPQLDEGVMFSFDGESLKKQKEVEVLLRRLHSAATLAIKNGVRVEWDIANHECDRLVSSVFGKKILESPMFSAWVQRNEAARDAFIDRTEKGMNLSDRVWKSVQQLRDEMEIAMTVSIGEGESASSMSRKVRQYLNDPDLMFRRFRYKKDEDENGNPIWGRKWKKRVKDEVTGKYRWIDYDRDDYETGRGVYKSSAKNAMRVARTETNMAYRRADHERWEQLDFVLGQRVQLSKNHPKKDICDKLQGDYPKDFVFDGWHPQCFCFVTPILMDEEEMARVNEAFLKGEKYIPKGKRITDYPQNFKDWVTDHAEDIAMARSRGTEPYFIRNNAAAIDEILDPEEKELTTLEKAAIRHEARTPEQEEAIRNRLRMRQKAKRSAETLLSDFEDMDDVDTSALRDAYEHARWDDVRKEALTLAQKKREIIEGGLSLYNELNGIKDVDVDKMLSAVRGGSLADVQSQVDALNKIKAQINSLTNIDNPIAVAKRFSMAQVINVNANVQKVFDRFNWDFNSESSLQYVKRKLEYEISWMETKGKKYDTWEVARDAYKRRKELVEHRIDMLVVKRDVEAQIALINSSKSVVGKQFVSEFDALFANDNTDIDKLKAKAADIKIKAAQIEAHRKWQSKKSAAKPASSYTPKSDAETKKDFVAYMKSIGTDIKESDVVVDGGFVHLQGSQHRYIYDGNNIETADEHKQLWNHRASHQRWGASGYIRTGNSFLINGDFRGTGVVGKIDNAAKAKLMAHGMTADDFKTVNLMDKKIDEFSLPVPIIVTRYVEMKALSTIFGTTLVSKNVGDMLKELKPVSSGKMLSSDPAYTSASTNETQNVFYTQYDVKLMIEIPPHTPIYFSDNYVESEIVLARSTQLQYLSSTIGITGGHKHVIIRCRVIV